jgi:UDP-3-O-acyl-N-acetylglucosamine deacetylase
MRYVLQGACLDGTHSRCEITQGNHFQLYQHTSDLGTVALEVSTDTIRVKNHLVAIQSNGANLDVVEHLFSALYGMDAFGVRVVVSGLAMPIFDGSSSNYAEVLDHDRIKSFDRARVTHPVVVHEQGSFIQFEPSMDDMLVITMRLEHAYIGSQQITITLDPETYRREIAPARTFVYTDETDPRLKNLPPYGIGITEKRIYAAEPLRFSDEPVRHKVLDLCGDLFVLQKRLCGTLRAFNTFHQLNHKFVARLMEETDNEEQP